MKNTFIIISTVMFFGVACKKEKAKEPITITSPSTVSFATDVQPIFQASCGTGSICHGTASAASNFVFETHAGASAVDESKLKGAINHTAGFKPMPQGGAKLSSDKIAKIEVWIESGKKND